MSLKLEAVSYSPSRPEERFAPLSGINLEIRSGEFVGLMGAHGSGKSTLLALINGHIRPNEGRVYIDGLDIHKKAPKGTKLPERPALLPQNAGCQLFETSLLRELSFSLRGSGLTKEEKTARAERWLEKLGFVGEKNCRGSPLCLSDGEKQRLAIASVMVREAPVLLLDEPFASLDSEERAKVVELVRELKSHGVTVILATNDADILAEYAERVIVLERGEIIKDGGSKAVFTDYFELLRNGIAIPSVRRAAQRLRERDVNMPGNIILYDQFIDRLKIIMWRKEK